jgi:hypothetical protein
MEDEPLVPSEPLDHPGVLVGGVVVRITSAFTCENLSVDGVREAHELLIRRPQNDR